MARPEAPSVSASARDVPDRATEEISARTDAVEESAVAEEAAAEDPADAARREAAIWLDKALRAAREGTWTSASSFASQSRNRVVAEIVLWNRLREGVGGWLEYRHFLERNPDWPGLARLRRSGERHIPEGAEPADVMAYFAGADPLTGTGALRLADALVEQGRRRQAEHVVVSAWQTLSLTKPERLAFLEDWKQTLAPHHDARMEELLWNGWTREAEAMLPLVDDDREKLARARYMTRRDAAGLMAAINAVPKGLRDDPGLAFERYLYRVNKGRWDEAEEYLREISTDAEALGRPHMWMDRRANLARQALRRGDVDEAYALAAQNFGSEGAAFADAEWVAGFIALEFRDDPEAAVEHFTRFGAVVRTPISRGRAGYWLGRAHEAAGDRAAAEAAWAEAAIHQTSFYGQLAAERAGLGPDLALAEDPPTDWRASDLVASPVVEAARLLLAAGQDGLARVFLRHAAEDEPAETRAALAQMAIDLGAPHIAVRIGKDAAPDGIIIPAQYYPLHPIAEAVWPIPTELALGIARQESEFNPAAVSPAGARGLMQLMPGTAREMATATGSTYDARRVGSDPLYNTRLGTAYLARMLRYYDGANMLAAAAYNAGPGRVNDWVETYGDPRQAGTDPIVWIEMIPFTETRNYVMRVLEALHVYRARLEGTAEPIRLGADLLGDGTG